MSEKENGESAKKIILKLKERGFTHKEIARQCMTTEQSLWRWLNERVPPNEIYLDALTRMEEQTRLIEADQNGV